MTDTHDADTHDTDTHDADTHDAGTDGTGTHDTGTRESRRWYVNTQTGEPELGMISPMEHRMGPYATREDALHAMQIAQERNALWEAETKAWNSWGKDDGEQRDGGGPSGD